MVSAIMGERDDAKATSRFMNEFVQAINIGCSHGYGATTRESIDVLLIGYVPGLPGKRACWTSSTLPDVGREQRP
jgi:hypothetical protein